MDDYDDCIYCAVDSLLPASVSRVSLAQEIKEALARNTRFLKYCRPRDCFNLASILLLLIAFSFFLLLFALLSHWSSLS
jgi:hypothetical protein